MAQGDGLPNPTRNKLLADASRGWGAASTNGPDNKFNVNTSWGDTDAALATGADANDNVEDFNQDSSGVNANVGIQMQHDMDMALAPNMFPRQTGHDSLTTEEDLLT